ncbi:hypothetical protein MKEN_00803800 [Mycena kentingensis (nom. inval.)]|nr:hypothetical protein MKEN_00803800 [Mycena kentingensis (nom. inval.)]
MHQSHNIAWHSLSSHLVFVPENKRLTPHATDLFSRELSTQANALNHFARTFAATVRNFSDTERTKFPSKFNPPMEGMIFSDEILARYDELDYSSITKRNQTLETWIARTERPDWPGARLGPNYSTSHGDLADVVKVLLAENEMATLLMLANHPQIPLADLDHLSWGHSFGVSCVRDWALRGYILFNILLSKPDLLKDDKYKKMRSYSSTIRFVTGSGDYDAQAYPHRQFFFGDQQRCGSWNGPVDDVNPLVDLEKLHEYLKMCFRLLYQYDLLSQECGARSYDWETEVVIVCRDLWRLKTEYSEKEGMTIVRFA